MAKINQEQRAGLAWNILVQFASNRDTLRYTELGDQIGIHHRAVRYALDKIFYHCLEKDLPPLSILVINSTKMPGLGFINSFPGSIEDGFSAVYAKNWHIEENPFEYALDGTEKNTLIEQMLQSPNASAEVWTKVKARGPAQGMFRQALLKAYNYECAICRTSFPEVLEGCHIVPWALSAESQKMNVQNGILLCANHHKLFDSGYITINENYRTVISSEIDFLNQTDEELTRAFDNKVIKLPKKNSHRPDVTFLRAHKERFIAPD